MGWVVVRAQEAEFGYDCLLECRVDNMVGGD